MACGQSLLVRMAAAVSSRVAAKLSLWLPCLHLGYVAELHSAWGLSGGVGGCEHGSYALCVELTLLLLLQHSPGEGSPAGSPTEHVLTVMAIGP